MLCPAELVLISPGQGYTYFLDSSTADALVSVYERIQSGIRLQMDPCRKPLVPPTPDSLDLAASHNIRLQHAFRQVGLEVHSLLTGGEEKMYQHQYR